MKHSALCIASAVAFVVALCGTTQAQTRERGIVPGYDRGEHELVKNDAEAIPQEAGKRCGIYFLLIDTNISFKYKVTIDGEEVLFYALLSQKLFSTVLDDSKVPPRMEQRFLGGTVTIMISHHDYEDAKECIPKPKP